MLTAGCSLVEEVGNCVDIHDDVVLVVVRQM